jgi:histone-lysine N-methyltransferase SETMAR
MQWKRGDSLCPKKFQTAPSAGKQMASVFWAMEGILLSSGFPKGKQSTMGFTATLFVSSLQNPAKVPRKMSTPVSVLRDNARPQSSKQTPQTLASLGYTVLPHPPYPPHLAPLDLASFNKIIELLHVRKFPTSDDMEKGVGDYNADI